MDDVLEDVLRILSDHRVTIDPKKLDTDLAEAEIDSLVFVDLVLAIEQHFDVRFLGEQMAPETFLTPRTIAEAVTNLKNLKSSK